ncbi:MAG: hypothetical protein U0Y08_03685 [Bacteroidia bacterium]
MEENNPKKSKFNFFFIVIGLITGSKVIKDFDFQTMTFAKPAIDTIYLITFVLMVVLSIKAFAKRS